MAFFQNYTEVEVLQRHTADLVSVIATDPSLFGDHVVQRGFAAPVTVNGIVNVLGMNDYQKGSRLLGLVDAKVRTAGTRENTRKYFNDFLMIIAGPMKHHEVAESLVTTFKSMDSSYASPLQRNQAPFTTGNQAPLTTGNQHSTSSVGYIGTPTSQADSKPGNAAVFSGANISNKDVIEMPPEYPNDETHVGTDSGDVKGPNKLSWCVSPSLKQSKDSRQGNTVGHQTSLASLRRSKLWDADRLNVAFINHIPPEWAFCGGGNNWESVMTLARQWNSKGEHIPRLERVDYGTAAHIRVLFTDKVSSQSYVGVEAQDYPSDRPTMWLNLSQGGNEYKKHLVVHEFGHALGLDHEHQRGDLWELIGQYINETAMINDPYVGTAYAAFIADPNFRTKDRKKSKYDPNSVMHYPFEQNWLKEDYNTEEKIQNAKIKRKEKEALLGILQCSRGTYVTEPSQQDLDFLNKQYKEKKKSNKSKRKGAHTGQEPAKARQQPSKTRQRSHDRSRHRSSSQDRYRMRSRSRSPYYSRQANRRSRSISPNDRSRSRSRSRSPRRDRDYRRPSSSNSRTPSPYKRGGERGRSRERERDSHRWRSRSPSYRRQRSKSRSRSLRRDRDSRRCLFSRSRSPRERQRERRRSRERGTESYRSSRRRSVSKSSVRHPRKRSRSSRKDRNPSPKHSSKKSKKRKKSRHKHKSPTPSPSPSPERSPPDKRHSRES